MNEGHLLIVAEEDDANFQVLQCSGFDKSTIHRLGSMPCMVRLRLHRSSVQELSTFERLTDMPGLQELCNLVTKIRACYVPRRRPILMIIENFASLTRCAQDTCRCQS